MKQAFLEFPTGCDGTFPSDHVLRREIHLGHDTINSCNIALEDVDGDGLQEIAIPITRGETDSVRLYRGDGSLLWENTHVRFYHAFYADPSPTTVGHMWYRSAHRHLLTEICDFDGDGQFEVVVGDGPIYVLDAADGHIKTTLDLGGGVALWTVIEPHPGRPRLLIATVDERCGSPSVVAVDATGQIAWRLPTPGRAFCDCIRAGDLTGDGAPEIGFSMDDVHQFWLIDSTGRVLWTKDVPKDLGPDRHVDDFVIDRVLPSGAPDGKQVFIAPGPNLLDADGNVIWTHRDRFDHVQSTKAADIYPERPGKELYTVESFRLRSHLLSCDGELLWTYDNFSQVKEGLDESVVLRLTTAGDILNWSGKGRCEIVQAEIATFRGDGVAPDEPVTLTIRVLDRDGQEVALFPYEDDPARGFVGAMCARAAHVTDSPGDDVVVVTHNSGRILIFSSARCRPEPPLHTVNAEQDEDLDNA